MELYLAGAVSGNCKPLWTDLAKAEQQGKLDLYLAGMNGRRWCVDLYLAGENGKERCFDKWCKDNRAKAQPDKIDIAILESFYYADKWTEWVIPHLNRFMLDSGAFTFMSNHEGSIDWNDYICQYADFINTNNVQLFFELDIDSVVGYEKVKKMRRFIEAKTGKQPIPVWHKSRGKEEFLRMCDEYSYVAIGGIVSKEITSQEYKYFPWFINEAHQRGAKIHGLGFTNLEGLTKYHFDSVDSTAWTTGNRFGSIYQFDGTTMVKHNKKSGQKLSDSRAAAINNFNEWVKFQKYAEINL